MTDRPYTKRDLLFLGPLLVVATAVRLPYLQLIPIITDEAFEVLAGHSIYQGQLTLAGPVAAVGPLVPYLQALIFWLFGPQLALPRFLVMIVGVLTVALTYFLGRRLGGRRAGLIAGALLAFSPVHTIINSHVAWSNSTTPFFFTLVIIVLHKALRRKDGWLLVLGGFLYGLALQTHISLLAVLPGLVIWFLARRDILNWLRKPWPYLAACAALLGYANVIIFNVLTGGGTLAAVRNHDYAWVAEPALSVYGTNLKNMVEATALTLGGQVPRIDDPLRGLIVGVLLLWLAVALVYAARKGEVMPILVVVSTLLIMPYFNKSFTDLFFQRYAAFLMPICFATMGLFAVRAIDRWRKGQHPLSRAVAAGGLALAILLALYPVRNTFTYFAEETQAGRDNRLSQSMTLALKEYLPPNAELYLSSGLRGTRADGGFRYLRALYYGLTMEGVDHWVLDLPDIVTRLESTQSQETWLLLPKGEFEILSKSFGFEPIEGFPQVHNDGVLVRFAPESQGP